MLCPVQISLPWVRQSSANLYDRVVHWVTFWVKLLLRFFEEVEISFKKTRITVKQVRNTSVPCQSKKQQPLGDATNKNYFQPGHSFLVFGHYDVWLGVTLVSTCKRGEAIVLEHSEKCFKVYLYGRIVITWECLHSPSVPRWSSSESTPHHISILFMPPPPPSFCLGSIGMVSHNTHGFTSPLKLWCRHYRAYHQRLIFVSGKVISNTYCTYM